MHNNTVIISGPSGAGEDSVIEALGNVIKVNRIVTTTTRAPRKNESEGHPYYFIDVRVFREIIEHGDFAEWAQEYNDNYYGVTHAELARAQGKEGLWVWKVEYKGVLTIQKSYPDILSILITAPLEVLEARIRRRDKVTDSHVEKRMNYTREWLRHIDLYDYVVENNEGMLAHTVSEVVDILSKEKYL